ncbi:Alpha-1,3/1,6-mannosyltransferase ALG2 [Hondaea fermentalgiana]|uniref:GDP-Man:Man(1)GlcNAc(2)-PP-Dol alpha-1,3-mannosyltransferase n=1 Tax=Hondaea fermentalgiana TaxID=2315210 RepID=A0A2R5GAJ0_9STRA|nr:Alpha-1,3/1,6-mannosyltransferase ALG2 [Hondaea fermentalgiana]|eukprot:GBG24704.1 Alpha-1,3/1,6-mannosyltransferase ALG2 [Hondaea fermentalgiana]
MLWVTLVIGLRVLLGFVPRPEVIFCDQVSHVVPLLRALTGAQVVFYCHFPDKLLCVDRGSALKRLYRAPMDWWEERSTGAADAVVVNSKFTASVFRESFASLERVDLAVLYPAIDMREFDRVLDETQREAARAGFPEELSAHLESCESKSGGNDDKGPIVVLSINRFESKKNLGLALEAMDHVRAKVEAPTFARVHLVLAGGYDPRLQENVDYVATLRKRVQDLGLEGKVSFLLSFSNDQRLELMRIARCVLYTPDREHFGIVPIEAMYAGCPVVAIASGGPLETVIDGKTGFLRSQEPADFGGALVQLVEDKSMALRFALSEVVGAKLKHYVLVRCMHSEYEEELMYMCLGKHAIYLVDDEMIGAGENGLLYSCRYSSLERCEVDVHAQEVFALYFLDKTPLQLSTAETAPEHDEERDFFPERLLFRSADRERLRAELETYFRTDFMFQHWKMPSAAFVVDTEDLLPSSAASRRGVLTANAAGAELTASKLAGYEYQVPRDFTFAGGFSTGSESGSLDASLFQSARALEAGANPTRLGIPEGIAVSTAASTGAIASARFVRTHDQSRPTSSGPPSTLEIIIHDKYPVTQMRYSSTVGAERQAREVAERYMHFIGDQVIDYRIVGRLQRYQRRQTGPSSDLAAVTCWRVQLRTAKNRHNTQRSQELSYRDVSIYVFQRAFIPPNMDHLQTAVIIGFSAHYDQTVRTYMEAVTDSFRCSAKATTWDQLVVQTKANALMLDEESYKWYADNLDPPVLPGAASLALAFCQSILESLRRAKITLRPGQIGSAEEPAQDATRPKVNADPFEYSLRLEHQLPGLAGKDVDAHLAREWKARVWRYLAFCVDGGLLPGELDIHRLALAVQQHNKRLQDISQVLQTLLYFRAVGEDFEQTPLALKVADERLMQNFTCNERVLKNLLQSGYIRWSLEATGDALEYPRFIVRLLQCGRDRVRWGHNLHLIVCEQLARYSIAGNSASSDSRGNKKHSQPHSQAQFIAGNEKAMSQGRVDPLSDLALHTIVPALIDLLNDESCSERIQVLVVSSLVNFTRNNAVLKNKVMAGGALRRGAIESICRFLQSKNDDLVKHSVSLLNNCTKSEQYRSQVAKFRAVGALMRLIMRNEFQPTYRPIQILTQTAAVIGNLASDSHLRDQITNSLGFTTKPLEERNVQIRIPKAIDELASLLSDPAGNFKSQAQHDSLRVTVIYALKNLCIKHADNKLHVGLVAIHKLVQIVAQTSQASSIQQILTDVTLRCLYVLSFHPDNCVLLRKHEILKVLQSKQGTSFSEFRVQIQRKLNESLTVTTTNFALVVGYIDGSTSIQRRKVSLIPSTGPYGTCISLLCRVMRLRAGCTCPRRTTLVMRDSVLDVSIPCVKGIARLALTVRSGL